MWQCSKCGAEVEEGVEYCWSCVISENLDAESPAPPEAPPETDAAPLVPIAAFSALAEAELARLQLESEGIAGFVTEEPGEESNGASTEASLLIQLLVGESDVERAQWLLSGQPAPPTELPAGEPIPVIDEVLEEPVAEAPPEPAAEAPPAPVAEALPEPEEPKATLTFRDILRSLESQLSALMDDNDTPGWTVNPALHPDVLAFIQQHSSNRSFMLRAQALQQNRASYYETVRPRAAGQAERSEPGEAGPAAP